MHFTAKKEISRNENDIFTISLLKGSLVNLVAFISSNGIGISENVEIETDNIKLEKGRLIYG